MSLMLILDMVLEPLEAADGVAATGLEMAVVPDEVLGGPGGG